MCDINIMNKHFIHDVATAIKNGQADQAARIISNSAMLIEADDSGIPLVHLFALMGEIHPIRERLNPAVLETVWGPSWTVVHTAAVTGCLDALVGSLKKNKHLLHWGDDWGNSPVHIAARHGNLTQLETFVDASHLVQRNRLFSTPIHIAALNCHLDQIASQLTPGLLILLDLSGETVLDVARRSGSIQQLSKELVWETEFLSDPKKRTVASVLQHAGIEFHNKS